MATMKIAAENVPTAMYALCNPIDVEVLETTALKLDSPNAWAFVVPSSDMSFVLMTDSTTNSSVKNIVPLDWERFKGN